MRLIINIVLAVLIALLGYMLYNAILEPIKFQEVKAKRGIVVQDKLKNIRTAQEIYRTIKGDFAPSFDSLNYVLKNDSIPFIKLISDPEDPENEEKFQKVITYSSAMDSIRNLKFNLDSLRYVPFAPKGTEFLISADTMTFQSTLVSVVEVGTPWKSFMGQFGDASYKKYDHTYDPNKKLKFGDLNKPSLSGNWE
jgi:hypothetical protein